MATEHAMATMERDANDRIDAAMQTLGERLGVTAPEVVPERLDTRMVGIRTLERHATVLEALVASTEPTKGSPKATDSKAYVAKEQPDERSKDAKR